MVSSLILFGLMGIAVGAFHWSASPWLVEAKQAIAGWLVDQGVVWPIGTPLPWWLLTNYPAQNDVLTILDGFVLISYILVTAIVITAALTMMLMLATRLSGKWSWLRFHHLAQTLIPLAAEHYVVA